MTEWQPIETAPKDGSEILVCKAYQDEVVELVGWNPILQAWLDRNAEPYRGATHWIAIPQIPSQ